MVSSTPFLPVQTCPIPSPRLFHWAVILTPSRVQSPVTLALNHRITDGLLLSGSAIHRLTVVAWPQGYFLFPFHLVVPPDSCPPYLCAERLRTTFAGGIHQGHFVGFG
jgi:hypothetical protein